MGHETTKQNEVTNYFKHGKSRKEKITENMFVNIHYNQLTEKKYIKIIEQLEETLNNFKTSFYLENISTTQQPLEIYIFDDKYDYQHYGKEIGLSNEGGKFYPGNPPTIYVYQQGNVLNLKHEFTHYLTDTNIPNAAKLPTVLIEGIADYIKHLSDNKFNSQGNSIDLTEYEIKSTNITQLLELEYSDNFHDNNMVYKAGHSIIMYLKKEKPELLKKYLNNENSEKYLELIKQEDNNFKHWLNKNNTDNAMQKINALEISKGEFLLTRKEIINGEIKNVDYYTANIKNLVTKEFVGKFAHVEYTGFDNYIRSYYTSSKDYLDINLTGEYHYLKLIKNKNNEIKLTFTNKDGSKYYTDSDEYKYKIRNITEKYAQQITDKKITYEQIKNIIEELSYINPNALTNIYLTHKPLGTIFTVKKLGNGMISALSLYDGEGKVSELHSESGLFKQVEGQQNNETFIFHNALQRFHISYDNKAYLAVENEDGQYKAAFIDGRKVNSDQYFDLSHLHKNELLSPSINHIQQEKLSSSQLSGTKIYNHKDSAFAQYSASQKEHGLTINKAHLLDDKGSTNTEDDVHEATINKGNDVLHNLKTMGFYISEELTDQTGKLIDKSDLFIHDHGKNIRYQLPKEIIYLKLIKKDKAYKLAVCDKEGAEYTEIPDEYRLIDPIFAHKYMKKDHSHKHINIGLIDFSQYIEGTLFKLKYDPNDYQIPRNENNEIIRITENQKYFTKVKILHNGTEIGMLSNDHHNFQGDIFLSIDYNYSYQDFLASYSPKVDIIGEKIIFESGNGDIGDTNKGYTDYKKIYFSKNENRPVNENPDSKIAIEKPYSKEPVSNTLYYQQLSDNNFNENDSYHRHQEDIDYDYTIINLVEKIVSTEEEMI
ncbi:MAG: hypothetical protein AB8W37_07670 [Arsenophonus endosymbiont of Dermacentor nuttalli]